MDKLVNLTTIEWNFDSLVGGFDEMSMTSCACNHAETKVFTQDDDLYHIDRYDDRDYIPSSKYNHVYTIYDCDDDCNVSRVTDDS